MINQRHIPKPRVSISARAWIVASILSLILWAGIIKLGFIAHAHFFG